jgi:N-acetylglucosaminyldiphosphoundecaprenol N-acetyl-beta-D-mannosaminyltransferase
MGGDRVRFGELEVDSLSFAEALDAIEQLVRAGRGGTVFTPNVDHVVLAEEDLEFRRAYASASLSLADGMPLVWGSRLLGRPVPEKVSGSDLVGPLMERAAARRWRVYLLGAGPSVADKAAEILRARPGVDIAGVDAPVLTDPHSARERAPIMEKIRRADPQLVLVAFGAPKQELFIHAAREELRTAVALGIGASLDFIAGTMRRAPRWMSEHGLEWFYRLCREPGRLWRRYLVRDPKFALILFRMWRELNGRRPVPLLPPVS